MYHIILVREIYKALAVLIYIQSYEEILDN